MRFEPDGSTSRRSVCGLLVAVSLLLFLIAWSPRQIVVRNASDCDNNPKPAGCAGTLPPGVTLQDIDGGATYFSSFSNAGILKDSTVFPIAVFDQYDLNAVQPNGMTRINGQLDVGINVWIHLGNGSEGTTTGGPTDIDAILNHTGSYVIADPTQTHVTGGSYLSTYGSRVIGFGYQDETEGGGCGTGEGVNDWLTTYSWIVTGVGHSCVVGDNSKKDTQFILDSGNFLRSQSPTRVVYQGYTNGFAYDWFVGGPVIELAQAGDVIGYDVYVIVDNRSTFGGAIPSVGHVWAAYESITAARGHANFTKPIWPDLEMSKTDTDSGMNSTGRDPTQAEISALVWHYIIGGARGITWFPFCFCSSPFGSNDVINDTTHWPSTHGTIKTVDGQVQQLASVLNSKFALGYVSTAGPVNYMAKWVPAENAFYVFAAIKQAGASTPTFTIAGSPTVTATVMFESRTVSVTAGSFSDAFTGETGWHVYKIPLP